MRTRRLAAALALVSCSVGTGDDGKTSLGEGTAPGRATSTTVESLTLLGRVVDDDGLPVAGARVVVGADHSTSAGDGWFHLEAEQPGEVTIAKPGWGETRVHWDGSAGFVEVRLDPLVVRGLRVNATAAGDDAVFESLLRLADETAVNALVFDTKQEGGRVLYDTEVEEAHRSGAVVTAYDPARRIAEARERGLYLITRVVTFEDAFRARSHPEEALAGPWIDPRDRDAWTYPLSLAVEACHLGFDEIQFDYVRFPSEEAVLESGQLDLSEEERVDAIEGFLAEARRVLHGAGCSIGTDVFGIVVSVDNDQGIGQRPEELSRHVDVFSPMVYPSHYSEGWLGFDDPNEHPYDVTTDAIVDALARVEPGTVLRPWLQSFWWTEAEIRRSIEAAEDLDVGWLLWNAVSNFSPAAIPTDAELGG